MPISQSRMLSLLSAASNFQQLVNALRSTIQTNAPAVLNSMSELEYSDLSPAQSQHLTIIYESYKALTNQLVFFSASEAQDIATIAEERRHFNPARQQSNNTKTAYRRRLRHRAQAGVLDVAPDNQSQIKRMPRTRAENKSLLDEIHQRIWAIEDKETWTSAELINHLSQTAPKHTPTVLLNQLVEHSYLIYWNNTKRYQPVPPNELASEILDLESGDATGASATEDEDTPT